METDNLLNIIKQQNEAILLALNPAYIELNTRLRNTQEHCPNIEYESDMGARIPYCKLYNTVCNMQCMVNMR